MKKLNMLILIIVIVSLIACEKNDEFDSDLLTSKVWGKPTVIHRPPDVGFWSDITCPAGSAYKYNDDGSYSENNYCLNIELTGEWKWLQNNKELELKTYFNNIYQRTFYITVIELNDTLFHSQVREERNSVDSYYEYKQYPRNTN